MVRNNFPSASDHTRTVLSSEPVTARRPAASALTALIGAVCACGINSQHRLLVKLRPRSRVGKNQKQDCERYRARYWTSEYAGHRAASNWV
jgi:hypothetical protein